ncbi:MAG: hypothetical protein P8L37_08335, partial [Phycisphaerales bacterium]|nr:hypothetical protein [Phycisphaerales bacterium]
MFVLLLSFEWDGFPTRLLVLLGLFVFTWLVGRLIERSTGLGPDTTDLTPPQLLVTGPSVVVQTSVDEGDSEQPDASPPSPDPGAIESEEGGADLGGFRCIAGGRNAEGQCDVPPNELFVGSR